MNKKQIENRIQSAFTSATPNNLQSIQADCQRVPQQTTRRTNFMTKRWKIAAMALAMVLVVAAVFGAVDLSQNAYAATVTIDVNPSISIEIDGKQRVVSVTANNQDAQIILADIKEDLVGVKVNVAVKAILGQMLAKGYISEISNSVLVSVDPQKGKWAYDEIVKSITDEIDIVMTEKNVDCSLMSQQVKRNQAVEELAQKYDITVGKAQLIHKLLSTPDCTYDEAKLAELTVNELAILLGKHGNNDKDIERKGAASDKAYITKQEALTSVVEYLNTNSVVEGLTEALTTDSIKKLAEFEIDLDFDNHTMVYEVDFEVAGYEYEIEVDATTGVVVDYQKSIDDKDDDRHEVDVNKDISEQDKQELLNKIRTLVDEKLGEGWFDEHKDGIKIEFDKGEVEVEFFYQGKEYELELDINGRVTEHMPGGRPEHTPQDDPANQALISKDEAKSILLNYAGIAQDAVLVDYEIELERADHGNMMYYEIEFELGGYEYEAKVNAKTGTIIKFTKQAD